MLELAPSDAMIAFGAVAFCKVLSIDWAQAGDLSLLFTSLNRGTALRLPVRLGVLGRISFSRSRVITVCGVGRAM